MSCKRCKDCIYFGDSVKKTELLEHGFVSTKPTRYHTCDRIKFMYGFNKHTEELAFVEDGSGFFAALRVRDDFGCVMWQPKEDKQI